MTLDDVAAAAAEGFRRMNGGTFDATRWQHGIGVGSSWSPVAMAVARAGVRSQQRRGAGAARGDRASDMGVWPEEAATSGLAGEVERQDAIFRVTGLSSRGPLPF